jgi:hypothetical protein
MGAGEDPADKANRDYKLRTADPARDRYGDDDVRFCHFTAVA